MCFRVMEDGLIEVTGVLQENNTAVVLTLVGAIVTLVTVIAHVLRTELIRLRNAVHEMTAAIYTALLSFSIIDDRHKEAIKRDLRSHQEKS